MSSSSEARGPHLQSKSGWAQRMMKKLGQNANSPAQHNRAIHSLGHVLMLQQVLNTNRPVEQPNNSFQ